MSKKKANTAQAEDAPTRFRTGGTVRWAHHPEEVKDALRRFGHRPVAQACHKNNICFIVRCNWDAPELGQRLEYVEGVAMDKHGFKFKHAWLLLDGSVLDLTLDMANMSYIASHVVPVAELKDALGSMRKRRAYGFVNEKALDRLLVLLSRGPEAAAEFDAASGYVGSDGSG